MNTNRICIHFLLLSLFGCSRPESPDVSFQVSPKFGAKDRKALIDFKFSANSDVNILLDLDALSVYDPRFENDSLLNNNVDLLRVVESLHHSQFVVENKRQERRFFSDIKLFEGESIEMKSVFKIDPDIDTIKIHPGSDVIIKSDSIEINRLKNRESDEEVRLYYLFRPTKEQTILGFEPLVLTSNWFSLKH